MTKITKSQTAEIESTARAAARHHPWRASWLEVASIEKDFDSRHPQREVLTSRGREVQRLWLEAFAAEEKLIQSLPQSPGGELCDRCGKPVEKGRWNVCGVCAANDTE